MGIGLDGVRRPLPVVHVTDSRSSAADNVTVTRDQHRVADRVAARRDAPAWLRHLALDGDLSKAEPKTLRYRVLHTAARIIRGARRRQMRIPATWPYGSPASPAHGSGSPPRPKHPDQLARSLRPRKETQAKGLVQTPGIRPASIPRPRKQIGHRWRQPQNADQPLRE